MNDLKNLIRHLQAQKIINISYHVNALVHLLYFDTESIRYRLQYASLFNNFFLDVHEFIYIAYGDNWLEVQAREIITPDCKISKEAKKLLKVLIKQLIQQYNKENEELAILHQEKELNKISQNIRTLLDKYN